MKNTLLITLIGLIGFSCKKALEEVQAGQTNKMYVQAFGLQLSNSYDEVILNAFDNNGEYETTAEIELDIDNNGTNDFSLSSYMKVYQLTSNFSSDAKIKVINSDWNIIRDSEKNIEYQAELCINNPTYSNFGSLVRVNYPSTGGCPGVYCHNVTNEYFAPTHISQNEIIHRNLNWEYLAEELNLTKYIIQEVRYGFNLNQDTLLQISAHFNYSCLNLPSDQEIYIPISKLVDDQRYLGWIKIRLSGVNTIEVLETAIQEH